MNKTLKKPDNGFTIIEVVLVLAIAALIMLMVFLALPALQRGQRDTQRKDDISRLQSAISNYKSSNRGEVPRPAKFTSFVTEYMLRENDQFADPKGGANYVLKSTSTDGLVPFSEALNSKANADEMYKDPTSADFIYVHYGGGCDFANQQITAGSSSSRSIVLLKVLEGGGYECRDVS